MNLEEKLIEELKTSVIEETLEQYFQYVSEKDPAAIKSEDWRTFVSLLQRNGAAATVRTVFRQVMIDVLSSTLAVFDGVSNLETLREDFRITYGTEVLDQTLSDILLESEE
jgi:hypothetical protein